MTHGTWQNSQASMVIVEIRIRTFIVKNPNIRLILPRDIRSRSWPNIGDSYGIRLFLPF